MGMIANRALGQLPWCVPVLVSDEISVQGPCLVTKAKPFIKGLIWGLGGGSFVNGPWVGLRKKFSQSKFGIASRRVGEGLMISQREMTVF